MSGHRDVEAPDRAGAMRLPAWIVDAPCSRLDPDDFDVPHGTPAARKACRECPFQEECLEWLLLWPTQYGFGAGFTDAERTTIRRKRSMPAHRRRRVR